MDSRTTISMTQMVMPHSTIIAQISMRGQVSQGRHLLTRSRISLGSWHSSITLTLLGLETPTNPWLRQIRRGYSMKGSFISKRLTRCFRTQIRKNATITILATTLPHLLVPLITPTTRRLSVWREKQSLRESGKKSTARPNKTSKRSTIRSSGPRSSLAGSSLRRNTSVSSRGSSSRRCGSR